MGKHGSYTIRFKKAAAKFGKETSVSEASRKFEVDRKRVREWITQLDAGKFDDIPVTAMRISGGGRKVYDEHIDMDIFEWFSDRRSSGVRVTGKTLLIEAHRRFLEAGVTTFKASNGWLQKWIKRHSVLMRAKTTMAQKMPVHVEEKISSFHKFVIRMRKLRDYDVRHIGNMDETAVYFDMPGNSTLHHKGDKSVIIRTTGHEKEKVTVVLSAMADGRKLPPLVVLKGKREPPARDIPSGILVKMSDNGWVNEVIIKWWVLRVWRRENERKMLVWDAFRAHRTDAVKAAVSCRNEFGANSDMVMIPGGCTGVLQPADVSWNKPFKAYIQDKWDSWMVDGSHTFTVGGNMRKPDKKTVLGWVKESWEALSVDIITRSFKKVGISNAMDGTEDDAIWMDSDGDDDDELDFPGFSQDDVDEAATFRENTRHDREETAGASGDERADSESDSYATDDERQ